MSRRFPGYLRRFCTECAGVSAVEFAVISVLFLTMVFGGLDLAHQSYVRSVRTSVVSDAARRASVQTPDFVQLGSTTEERVVAAVKQQVNPVAPGATYAITIKNFEDFTGVNNPEKLLVDNDGDGQYDASQHDCFEDMNSDGEFNANAGRSGVGAGSDVVYYKINVAVPHLFPWQVFVGDGSNYTLTAQTVIRNQPYSAQANPPVVCG